MRVAVCVAVCVAVRAAVRVAMCVVVRVDFCNMSICRHYTRNFKRKCRPSSVCCSVLQCVASCCSVLHCFVACVAVCVAVRIYRTICREYAVRAPFSLLI